MRTTALLLGFIAASLLPGIASGAQKDWIAVAPIAQSGEAPEEVELQELEKRPGSLRQRLVLVAGRLDNVDFVIRNSTLNGLSRLRQGGAEIPLLFLIPPAETGLRTRLETMARHGVELLGRFADLSGDIQGPSEMSGETQVQGIVVDSIRLTPPEAATASSEEGEEEGMELLGEPTTGPARPARPSVESSSPASGTRDIAPKTAFRIRFSTDMDPATFAGNVKLLYPDDPAHPVAIELEYDEGSRTLTAEPVTPLMPLREIHLTFHRGITSRDGAPLARLSGDGSTTSSAKLQSRRSSPPQAETFVVKLVFFVRGFGLDSGSSVFPAPVPGSTGS